MRIAVISDIHSNLHALSAVLAALEEDDPDEIWCLGDLVGYGPRPNPCCAEMQRRAALSLVGNHDLGVLGEVSTENFAEEAAAAARWTEGVLSDESRSFLASLRPEGTREGVELYHASPRDPVWEYLLDAYTIGQAFEDSSAPLVLVGHSHVPMVASLDGDELKAEHAPDGTEVSLAGARHLLNPGSVGQPRDGDARAAYLLLEDERAVFRRVEYPIERTQEEMRERGLPEALAERLGHGL